MDDITQARHNFVLAFQYCWNGEKFPVFKDISVSEPERIHTGYCAIDLLDEALGLRPDFQEARDLRGEIWHAILTNNSRDIYRKKYLKSKAWAETRERFFAQMGRLCICGDTATQVHHKTYDNIGKEDLLTELVGLCDRCHENVHQSENPNGANNATGNGANNTREDRGKVYWDEFKTYVEDNGNQLQLYSESDSSIYGIQIDQTTRKSEDRHKDGAFWLVAYRDSNTLQANLRMQSLEHYNDLKRREDTIKRQFEDSLGELKWNGKDRIGFVNATVGPMSRADTDQEFPWLHDRLVRLYEVFQPLVLELQERTELLS